MFEEKASRSDPAGDGCPVLQEILASQDLHILLQLQRAVAQVLALTKADVQLALKIVMASRSPMNPELQDPLPLPSEHR